jgi:hypothetical protein
MALLSAAIERGVEPEQLAKLLDLQERWQATQAAEAFAAALIGFQSECPMIAKRRDVKSKDGTTKYCFAGYEDIFRVVRPLLVKYKIVHSFSSPVAAEGVYVLVCHLQVGSHRQDRPFTTKAPNLVELAKAIYCNEAQAAGAWNSYTKRYAFCQALGIVVCDEDTDAGPDPFRTLDRKQILALNGLIEQVEKLRKEPFNFTGFLEWLMPGLETLDNCPADKFSLAEKELNRLIAKLQKGGKK